MIDCSKMLQGECLRARRRHMPCDLSSIRSWMVTELGVDLSAYEVRVLMTFVSIFRGDKVSKKNGFCNLYPPSREKYSLWCCRLQELVKQGNEPKKSSVLPFLAKVNAIKRQDSRIIQSSKRNLLGRDDSMSLPNINRQNTEPVHSHGCVNDGSTTIVRSDSDPTSDRVARVDSVDSVDIEDMHQQRKRMQLRYNAANLRKEATRREMLGTIDYNPHEPPSSTHVSVVTAPSFNDLVDTVIFGGLTSLDTILRPDENGDPIPRPKTAIAREKIRFQHESNYVKNEVFRILKV